MHEVLKIKLKKNKSLSLEIFQLATMALKLLTMTSEMVPKQSQGILQQVLQLCLYHDKSNQNSNTKLQNTLMVEFLAQIKQVAND